MNKNIAVYRNYKLIIFQYDGLFINGWHGQNPIEPNNQLVFIKDELTKVLRKILNHKIDLTCAARTDSGVNGLYNVCNFTLYTDIDNKRLKYGLNYYLPFFIRIINVKTTHIFFSSRFWAKARQYQYHLVVNPFLNPLLKNRVLHLKHETINVQNMITAQNMLLGLENVANFTLNSFTGNLYRTMSGVNFTIISLFATEVLVFEFLAKSFAHHQIRITMHYLIKIGLGKLTLANFALIIKNQFSSQKILSQPHGLYLTNVIY